MPTELICFRCKKEITEREWCSIDQWCSLEHRFCSEECLDTYLNQRLALQELDYYTNIESKL